MAGDLEKRNRAVLPAMTRGAVKENEANDQLEGELTLGGQGPEGGGKTLFAKISFNPLQTEPQIPRKSNLQHDGNISACIRGQGRRYGPVEHEGMRDGSSARRVGGGHRPWLV